MSLLKKRYFKWTLVAILLQAISLTTNAQDQALERVEPPFWFTGMHNTQLQLLVYGKNISQATVKLNHEGIRVKKVQQVENPNYLFIDLEVSSQAESGKFPLEFEWEGGTTLHYTYELKEKNKTVNAQAGLDGGDVIYLVTPDRFANGNPGNDAIARLKEQPNREFHGGRHGGDLQGVKDKIAYMKDLGVTTVWLNPVLENDMKEYSYHGYSTTDYYKVDARYGSNEEYVAFSKQLHDQGMKLVMDIIFNHCGLDHWWMKDLPMKDWINQWPEYTGTNHAIASLSDPYASDTDKKQMVKGWFVPSMPDLNHENDLLANYLIQMSLWWIEYANLDGIRMDTYPYNQKDMMAKWVQRILQEYPDFYIVGETWVDNVANEAYWAGKQTRDKTVFNSYLPGISDFPVCFATRKAFGKDGDLKALYDVLSKDFLYSQPENNKIFLDNHDMDRFFSEIGGDPEKFKLAMTFLLTTRGVPQLFYGTEILMKGKGDHGVIREDFPGGWPDDTRDAFTRKGRNEPENEIFEYVRKLLRWRQQEEAVHHGKLKHFVPYDNVYVYARYTGQKTVMVLINNNEENKTLEMSRFKEVWDGHTSAWEVLEEKHISDLTQIRIPANRAMILELAKKGNETGSRK
ncbi:glycoside hydrolase family 13 protein [Rapidithrix thailandica]|uniref:Glycoside hydrolase family 13 protein n=1 Tax=Rapidithrix thailandica TaxID=413964 RepID=A0AAW9S1N2_9BACT